MTLNYFVRNDLKLDEDLSMSVNLRYSAWQEEESINSHKQNSRFCFKVALF